ncbi:MAG: AEC family transporter [Bacteroidia bacterium]|jgi:predicted permease|nr:MAG: AEC family transporter [Bacteroidia bacterium]
METEIIISQIVILAIVVIIGAVSARFRVITLESKDMLSKVIFNISLPLMLFTNFLKLEATPRLLANSAIVLLLSGLVLFFMLLAGWLTARVVHMKGREEAVFKAHSMFGNIIFLGFPLITALYGEEGLLYASMFQLVSNIILWTLGVVILSHGNGVPWQKSLLKIFNPNTVATLAGLVFFLFSIKVPKIIVTPFSELGSANTWLSMLYIGVMMYFSDARGLLGRKIIYILSFNRLVLVPAILISVFALFASMAGFAPDRLVTSVIILEAAMPCMASVVIMSKELGADDHLAVANVFVSTLISIVTLPLVLMAINRFL